jgi:hypothetical protein
MNGRYLRRHKLQTRAKLSQPGLIKTTLLAKEETR